MATVDDTPGPRDLGGEDPVLTPGRDGRGHAIYAGRPIAASLQARPLAGRIGVALYGLAFYVQKTALPFGIWPLYQIPLKVDPLACPIVTSTLAVVALTTGLFLLRRKWPAGLAAWLSYGIILSPVSGLMQSGPQLVAARYSYLSCLPWALLAGAATCLVLRATASGRLGRAWGRAWAAAVVIYLVGLGAATREQARIWHDPHTFWSYAVAVAPASPIAHGNLGSTLIRQGRLTDARDHLRTAVILSPHYVEALSNLASVLARLGEADEARDTLQRLDHAREARKVR
jgi:tetratricopeptide (TPR) repeat protein